jgi:hypothetical protein
MEMQFVEFYPDTKPDAAMLGTAHVHVSSKEDPIMNFDIRGILVFLNWKKQLMVNVPGRTQFDPKQNKNVKFTVFEFCDKEVKKRLINFVKDKYIEWKKSHPEFKEHVWVKKTQRHGMNPNYQPSQNQQAYENRYKPYPSAFARKNTVRPQTCINFNR